MVDVFLEVRPFAVNAVSGLNPVEVYAFLGLRLSAVDSILELMTF